jgi:hypothetical protein
MPRGTYIYGVVQAARAPSLAGVPVGLSGAGRPRALRAGPDRWVVVADVPLEQYGERALAGGLRDLDWVASRAMSHEAVVEHLAKRAPVVPMKLFTIFLTDDRAIDDIEAARKTIDSAFRRISSAAEWSVRVFGAGDGASAVHSARGSSAARSGAAFLRLKKKAKDERRAAAVRAARVVTAAHRALARIARASRVKPPVDGEAGARLLLDAAYLVADNRRARFRAEVKRRARECRAASCNLTLTGPWPAYHFIE